MKIPYCELKVGDIIPPFYYGYSYKEDNRDIVVWHIIPFNFIIRFFRHCKYLWDKFRSNLSYIDKKIMRIEKEASDKWYEYYNNQLEELVRQKFLELTEKN